MSKYNSTLKYVASTPRSQRKGKGARYYGSTIPSLPSSGGVSLSYVEANFVTLNTEQAISGIKDFTNGLKIGGLSAYKSQADTIYLDCNLVVRGGITAFGTNETITASIFDALPIDGITLKRTENGVLYVASGGSGGTGGGISIEDVESYLTTNGYATQSWVTGKGYITGVTSSMVTNALGYTPYNSANFTKATIKSTLGISDWALASAKPTYAYSEISGTPTSLKNPNALSWSGYSTGSYDGSTAQNIALPTKLSQLTDDVVSGKYLSLAGGTITGKVTISCAADSPLKINSNATDSGIYFNLNGTAKTWVGYEPARGSVLYHSEGSHRLGIDNAGVAFSDSNTLLHSGNYSEYALPITGGTVNGDISLPNGNRLISPSGNIAGTRIFGDDTTNYRTILGTAILNTLLIGNSTLKFWKGAVSKEYEIIDTSMPSISFPKYIATGIGTTEQSGYKVKGNSIDATFGANDATGGAYIWVASYHALRFSTNGAERMRITPEGNVAIGGTTASEKLHVYGNLLTTGSVILPNNENIKLKNAAGLSLGVMYMATSDILNIGYESSRNGCATDINGETLRFRVGSSNAVAGVVLNNGYWGLNVTSPTERLHVGGNILATGGITAQNSSDRRLKKNIRKFNASKVLMSLGAVWEYEYIDSEVQKNHIYEGTHYGLIYQHVKGTKLDVMCHEREDGMGALNYIHPKFISLIAGATMENISEVEKLKRKIRTLEAKVKQLENRA